MRDSVAKKTRRMIRTSKSKMMMTSTLSKMDVEWEMVREENRMSLTRLSMKNSWRD